MRQRDRRPVKLLRVDVGELVQRIIGERPAWMLLRESPILIRGHLELPLREEGLRAPVEPLGLGGAARQQQ